MMKKTIEIIRNTVCRGSDLQAGKTYDLDIKDANLLIALSKAKAVDSESDVEFSADNTKSIDNMKKDELIEYAKELEIELQGSETKAELIFLITNGED